MRKRFVSLVSASLCVLAMGGLVLAHEIAEGGGLYWDDPNVPPEEASVECDLSNPEDAKLYERIIVMRGADGPVVLDETKDTGVRGFEQPGVGLAIDAPWFLCVETDDFTSGQEYRIKHCQWWEVHGSCSGGPVITQTFCVKKVENGEIVPFDAECCRNGGTFTGTGPYSCYLPLIIKNME